MVRQSIDFHAFGDELQKIAKEGKVMQTLARWLGAPKPKPKLTIAQQIRANKRVG